MWSKDIVTWEENGYLCISIPFTWLLPKGRDICLNNPHKSIAVGGPAVRIIPEYLSTYAEIEPFIPNSLPLNKHNPLATRTSFGCPNGCSFCLTNKIEGEFRELNTWNIAPIIIDNNFLACSNSHIEQVCDSIKELKNIDFQGIDPLRVTAYNAKILASVKPSYLRIGYDSDNEKEIVWHAVDVLRANGNSKKSIFIYCLINYGETIEQANNRLLECKNKGYTCFAMRYQPPDTLKKDSYIHPNWNNNTLKDFCRYWNRQSWFGGITWDQYKNRSFNLKYQSKLSLFD